MLLSLIVGPAFYLAQVFIWRAVFAGRQSIGGFTLPAMLTYFGAADVMRQPTRNLSLGERMKCEFIMSMFHAPAIVFLDEPTIGLDVIAKEAIHDFIKEMNREGVTFILTTHDLADVERLARRVIVISSGEIVFDDALEALRRCYGSRKRIHLG